MRVLSIPQIAFVVCVMVAVSLRAAEPDMGKVMTVARDTAKARVEKANTEIARLDAELRAKEDKSSAAYVSLAERRKSVDLYRQYHVAYVTYVQAKFDLEALTETAADQLQRGRFASEAQEKQRLELETAIEASLVAMREASAAFAPLNEGAPLNYPHRQVLVQMQQAEAKAREDRQN
jgi:hypothetical protein